MTKQISANKYMILSSFLIIIVLASLVACLLSVQVLAAGAVGFITALVGILVQLRGFRKQEKEKEVDEEGNYSSYIFLFMFIICLFPITLLMVMEIVKEIKKRPRGVAAPPKDAAVAVRVDTGDVGAGSVPSRDGQQDTITDGTVVTNNKEQQVLPQP